jgi:hypothetical protein
MAGIVNEMFSSVSDCAALSAYVIDVCELKEVRFHTNAIDS